MSKYITWVVTETQNGQEVEVVETYSLSHAHAVLCDYTKEDMQELIPCIYKRLPNGELTTEY